MPQAMEKALKVVENQEFKVGQKVIYNPNKKSVHHIGIIIAIDDVIHIKFMFNTLMFPLSGLDDIFKRQLIIVDDDYEA